MRYIIIGAGAVGGTIGGCLALAGHEVVLTARGAHLAALRAHGLRLGRPSGTQTIQVPAIGGPDEISLRQVYGACAKDPPGSRRFIVSPAPPCWHDKACHGDCGSSAAISAADGPQSLKQRLEGRCRTGQNRTFRCL